MTISAAPTVLLVEDDPQYHEALRWALEDAGLQVDSASDIHEVLDRPDGARPSVAVIDVWLPSGDGTTLAAALRQRYGALPIITITADDRAEAKAREMGAVSWLRKPFDIDDLVNAVTGALQGGERST